MALNCEKYLNKYNQHKGVVVLGYASKTAKLYFITYWGSVCQL